MALDLQDVVVKTRALAQTHPMSGRAQAYLNATIARERTEQPIPELGIWAGYALVNGYCLRRVEEEDTGRTAAPDLAALGDGVEELDRLASEVAGRIRTEQADDFLLFPEPAVVDALDRLIAGEVERRLSHWEDTLDAESYAEIEEYIAWWTIKGYALRVAEVLMASQGL